MTARKTDNSPATTEVPDLSDAMYCEHYRTRVHCEDCRAGGKAQRNLTPADDAPPVVA